MARLPDTSLTTPMDQWEERRGYLKLCHHNTLLSSSSYSCTHILEPLHLHLANTHSDPACCHDNLTWIFSFFMSPSLLPPHLPEPQTITNSIYCPPSYFGPLLGHDVHCSNGHLLRLQHHQSDAGCPVLLRWRPALGEAWPLGGQLSLLQGIF